MSLDYGSGTTCWYLGRICPAHDTQTLSSSRTPRPVRTEAALKGKGENAHVSAFPSLSFPATTSRLSCCITFPLPCSAFFEECPPGPQGPRSSLGDNAAVLPVTLGSRLVPLGLSFSGGLLLLCGFLILGLADGGGTVLG